MCYKYKIDSGEIKKKLQKLTKFICTTGTCNNKKVEI